MDLLDLENILVAIFGSLILIIIIGFPDIIKFLYERRVKKENRKSVLLKVIVGFLAGILFFYLTKIIIDKFM
jgi:peptidoglycan biosynthesis protein MviN/MurJ (putative lipid II flippase)